MREGNNNSRWLDAREGDRFGAYRLVRLDHVDRLGQVWVARCDCGTEARRSLAALRCAVRKGRRPQCARCGQQQRLDSGGASRSGRASLAARRGDKRAFVELDAVSIDDDLPDWGA
jgi:hypothetical protein